MRRELPDEQPAQHAQENAGSQAVCPDVVDARADPSHEDDEAELREVLTGVEQQGVELSESKAFDDNRRKLGFT